MADDIPFDRTFDLEPGVAEEIAPGVRRMLCDNPSPFTFKGTVSYIVGRGQVAIVDPGPDDERHVAALLAAVAGETGPARQGGDRRDRHRRGPAPAVAAAARGRTAADGGERGSRVPPRSCLA